MSRIDRTTTHRAFVGFGRERSCAGLHESVIGVTGEAALLDAVLMVCASLWSDAALLYRRVLKLDAKESAISRFGADRVQRLVEPVLPGMRARVLPQGPLAARFLAELGVIANPWATARLT